MDKTFLITGGAGNLACQLSFDLVDRGHHCILVDIADSPVTTPANECQFVCADITQGEELSAVFAEHRPTVVIHFATLLSGKSEEDRPAAWRVNADGAFEIFEAAVKYGARQIFFPSSTASYGAPLPNPVSDDFSQWPMGLYGVTKVAVERLGFYYHQKYGLDFRSIRLPIVISAFAPAGAASAYASHAFIASIRQGEYTFRVRPETCPSIIYVKDVLRSVMALMDAPSADLTRRVYNIQAMAPSTQELADAISSRLPEAKLQFDPDPAIVRLIDSWPIAFDDSAAQRDWGWRPQFDLDAMADDFIEVLQRESQAAQ